MKALTLGLLITIASAANVQAQTATTITAAVRAEFDPSPDHNNVVGGVAVLDRYDLEVIGNNGLGVLIFTQQLGKPTPNAAGKIIVPVPRVFQDTANNQVYRASVFAVGPGGASPKTQSNPFVKPGPPAAPPTLVIQDPPLP